MSGGRGGAARALLLVLCGAHGVATLAGCREGNELVITVVAGAGLDGAAVTELVVEMTPGTGGTGTPLTTTFPVDGELDDGRTSFSIRPGRYRGPLLVVVTASADVAVLATGQVLTEVVGGRQDYEVLLGGPGDSGVTVDSGGGTPDSGADSGAGDAGPGPCTFDAPLAILELNTPLDERDPHVGPLGLQIWFASNANPTLGAFDMRRAIRTDTSLPFGPPVSEGINTASEELGPTLPDDVLTLIFSSNRGASGDQDLYMAARATGMDLFITALPLAGVNMAMGVSDSEPWLSPDSLRLYFSSSRPLAGDHNLWVATRLGPSDDFSIVGEVSELSTSAHEDGPTLSRDERVIVFEVRPETGGTSDLWYAERPTGSGPFSPPMALGVVNTPANEVSPFFGADGTLYFASDRAPLPGGGGFDLYRSALICSN